MPDIDHFLPFVFVLFPTPLLFEPGNAIFLHVGIASCCMTKQL